MGLSSTSLALLLFASLVALSSAQCPWRKSTPELNSMCVCVIDEEEKLSVQCSDANFPLLMTTIHKMIRNRKMDLLYVNDSDIGVLNSRIFDGLHIENIQFSYCRIYNISDQAFVGLKNSLENMNLQGNRLDKVPSGALAELQNLKLLDLSDNRITTVPDGAFASTNLVTLKMGDNILQLSANSFQGLEKTLKNLNLKGSGLQSLPPSVLALETLAFLDLAQNEIRQLLPGSLSSLHSLAALNLERNLIQRLQPQVFRGVNDTLSSLSLLNNLISEFPTAAINSLTQLRVLDIGFNLLETIPDDAFSNVRLLTLLALDGNQLETVPQKAFEPVVSSLKGLSVGGKFLNCDCRISWILDWMQSKELQVTSRERKPQFCGSPSYLNERSFYQLRPEDLMCNDTSSPSFTVTSTASMGVAGPQDVLQPLGAPGSVLPPEEEQLLPEEEEEEEPKIFRGAALLPVRPTLPTTPRPQVTSYRPDRSEAMKDMDETLHRSGIGSNNRQDSTMSQNQPTRAIKPGRRGGIVRSDLSSAPSSSVVGPEVVNHRPQLVRHPDSVEHETSHQFGTQDNLIDEVIIQDAYRKDNSVIIQWDSEVSNILGFRVVYRLFGDKQFKLGPPLASSEREFKIRNVPTQECIVVCVVSLEDINVTPETVAYNQCREIRTEDSAATHMDTIIIAASAAICGTVIVAVVVFICCNRRRGSSAGSRHSSKDMLPASVISQGAAPLASLGTLGGGGVKADWDTLSVYSQRSIPRARMYHLDKGNINAGYTPDDLQSHISAASLRPHSRAFDGQFGPSLATLSLSRPDLRMSRQSLAGNPQLLSYNNLGPGMMGIGGMGGMGGITGLNTRNNMGGGGAGRMSGHFSRAASTRSRHSRSKSRDRASSRLSHAESSHSLTEYDSGGWTDHDMDVYMARNPTRDGLVQL